MPFTLICFKKEGSGIRRSLLQVNNVKLIVKSTIVHWYLVQLQWAGLKQLIATHSDFLSEAICVVIVTRRGKFYLVGRVGAM